MESIIRQMELFKDVSEETISGLLEFGEINCYIKGKHLFRDKDEVKKVHIICSGKVALYKLNESAQKKVIFILGKNKIINAVILDELLASINCEIFENAEILSIDREKFSKLMEKDFELTKIVIISLSMKVRRLYRQMKNSTPIKIEKRVAAKLWKLCKDYGIENKEGVLIDLTISITYLADMFGMPRETISRAIKKLQNEKLIVYKNKKIVVKDKEELAKFFKGL